jgi:integrase
MPTVRLTDKYIQNLRVKPPKNKGDVRQMRYFDTGIGQTGLALILLASYGGAKSWFAGVYDDSVATRKDKETGEPKTVRVKKLRTHMIGSYPAMTLKAARDAARAYYDNPQRFAQQAAVGSFGEIAEKWFRDHVIRGRLRTRYEIRRQLNKYILPVWGPKPFLEIRRRNVAELLDTIAEQNGPVQADACLANIRLIMQWWQARDDDYTSPIVKGMNKAKPQARERILNDNEIRRLWAACDESGSYGAMVKLLLLTAQRREKVSTMRWDDIVGDQWIIRSKEHEKNNAGTLKLPQLALEIIKAQPKIHGNPYVFAGIGDGPFASFAEQKTRLDQKLGGMAPWVVHDLRRTARSLLTRLGISHEHAERVLGHKIKGVAGVYNRHDYAVEKAHALSALAGLIERIVKGAPDNVIPMHGG